MILIHDKGLQRHAIIDKCRPANNTCWYPAREKHSNTIRCSCTVSYT